LEEFDDGGEEKQEPLLGARLKLIAAARNHPNCLVLPFSLELIRVAA